MKKYNLFILVFSLFIVSCEKGFLNKKPDKSLLVPTTISDLWALLDNTSIMNYTTGLNVAAGDELSTTDNGWKAWSSPAERNSFIWKGDIYEGSSAGDWSRPYQQMFYANVVLEGLGDLSDAQNDSHKELNGAALFYRAFAAWTLVQMFTQPYDKNTASRDPGVPYPLTANVNQRPERQTIEQTYTQIINDFLEAAASLPVQAALKSRPARPAALAMLARVYLTLEDYAKSVYYADECLKLNNKLLDFNLYNVTSSDPFPPSLPNGNDEVLFHTVMLNYSFLSASLTGIDTDLYKSYSANDLRKQLYFLVQAGVNRRKNSYGGSAGVYGGIATDEIYLMRAECYARQNKVQEAINDLNTLLITRWKKGTFIPYTASNADDALRKILDERKKELVLRGLRWFDLRRLNKDSRFAITISRTINGQLYALVPGDKLYTFPIPDNEISSSGIEQNPR